MPRGMNSGGDHGGGRPKGSLSKRTTEIAARALAEGLTPLDVILRAMRTYAEAEVPDWDKAASFARDAAPYIHPRLAAVANIGPGEDNRGVLDMTMLARRVALAFRLAAMDAEQEPKMIGSESIAIAKATDAALEASDVA